jgi:hypothetical protein
MRAPSRGVWRDPGAADAELVRSDAAQNTTRPAKVQIVDDLGHRLPHRRHAPVEGAPRLQQPAWYAIAASGGQP